MDLLEQTRYENISVKCKGSPKSPGCGGDFWNHVRQDNPFFESQSTSSPATSRPNRWPIHNNKIEAQQIVATCTSQED